VTRASNIICVFHADRLVFPKCGKPTQKNRGLRQQVASLAKDTFLYPRHETKGKHSIWLITKNSKGRKKKRPELRHFSQVLGRNSDCDNLGLAGCQGGQILKARSEPKRRYNDAALLFQVSFIFLKRKQIAAADRATLSRPSAWNSHGWVSTAELARPFMAYESRLLGQPLALGPSRSANMLDSGRECCNAIGNFIADDITIAGSELKKSEKR